MYNGEATAPELVNDPPGLNIDIVYAGRDGTVYSASTAAPRDVGSYTLTATVRMTLLRQSAGALCHHAGAVDGDGGQPGAAIWGAPTQR